MSSLYFLLSFFCKLIFLYPSLLFSLHGSKHVAIKLVQLPKLFASAAIWSFAFMASSALFAIAAEACDNLP